MAKKCGFGPEYEALVKKYKPTIANILNNYTDDISIYLGKEGEIAFERDFPAANEEYYKEYNELVKKYTSTIANILFNYTDDVSVYLGESGKEAVSRDLPKAQAAYFKGLEREKKGLLADLSDAQIRESVDVIIYESLIVPETMTSSSIEGDRSIEDVDLTGVKSALEYYRDNSEGEIKENFDKILEPEVYNLLIEKALERLSKYGLVADTLNDEDIVEEKEEKGNNFKTSIQKSKRDSSTVRTKLLVGALPAVDKLSKTNAGIKPVYTKGKFLGRNILHDSEYVWSILEKELSDITDKDKMLEKLKEVSFSFPSLYSLVQYLENPNVPENRKIEFYSAMLKTKNSFINVYKDGKDIRIGTADTLSKEDRLLKEWEENFKYKFVTKVGDSFKLKETSKKAIADFRELQKRTITLKRVDDGTVKDISQVLGKLGITASEEGIMRRIQTYSKKDSLIKNMKSFVTDMSRVVGEIAKIEDIKVSGEEELLLNIFNNEKHLKTLAQSESLFRTDIGTGDNTVLGAEGNSSWLYSEFDFIKQTISELKEGRGTLIDLMNDPYYENSELLKWLIENPEKADIEYLLSAVDVNDTYDKGSTNEDLTFSDDFAFRAEMILTGKFPLINYADKGRTYVFKGPKLPTNGIKYENGKYNIRSTNESMNSVKRIADSFKDEMAATSIAFEELFGENKLKDKDLIEGWHFIGYDSNNKPIREINGVPTGRAFTSHVLPSLGFLVENEKGELVVNPKVEELGLYKTKSEIGKPLPLTNDARLDDGTFIKGSILPVRQRIADVLESKIREQFDIALEYKVIESDTTKGLVANGISLETLKKYKDPNDSDYTNAIRKALADATVNSIIMSIETTKIFHGDPRKYKDFTKRTPSVIAPGTPLLISEGVSETFTQAVVADIVAPSVYYTGEETASKISEVTGNTVDEVLDILKSFKRNNIADAQGLITLERWKEIKTGLGEFDTETEKVYSRLKSGKFILKDLKVVAQPLKGMYYNLDRINGTTTPVYLKYSSAVLIPSLIEGTPLQELEKAMKAKKVDEVIMESGVKSGVSGKETLLENNEFKSAENIKLTPRTLKNRYWRLQQKLPFKETGKDTLVASQIQANIITNILYTEEYSEGRTGNDIVNELTNVVGELSNIEAENVLSIFKTEDSLYKFLIDKSDDPDLISALKQRKRFDELPQYRNSIERTIATEFKKTVKLKQPGTAAIQISSLGLSDTKRYTSLPSKIVKGIKRFSDEPLKPPRVENGEILAGQVFLPYTVVTKIKGWENMTGEELREKIDPKVLKAVGYRIPNQKLSSNDALEIVGILPPEMGNSVVIYDEITTKTGSDFDIDKMYFILPNVRMFDGKLEYIPYMDENSNLEERYFEYYKEKMFDVYKKDVLEILAERKNEIKEIIDKISITAKERNENYSLAKMLQSKGSERAEAYFELTAEKKEKVAGLYNELAEVESVQDILRELVDNARLDNKIPSYEEFEALPIEKQNTKRALQNRRLEIYTEILTHPKHFLEVVSTVDSEFLKEDIESFTEKDSLDDLQFYSVSQQLKYKNEFIGGKFGVGQVANHLIHHSKARQAKLFVKNLNIGRGNTIPVFDKVSLSDVETGDLSGLYTEEINGKKYLISDVLSAYLNAYVDIAKDPFIVRGNHNTLTANPVLLLTRLGVHPKWTNRFVAQPILKDLAKLADIYNSKIVDAYGKKYEKALQEVILKWSGGKYNNRSKLIDAVASLDGKTSIKDLEENIKEGSSEFQLRTLVLFLELQGKSKDLRKSMLLTKTDREGVGIDMTNGLLITNLKLQLNDLDIGNANRLLENTFLSHYMKNSVDLLLDTMGSKFLTMSTAFSDIINTMAFYDGEAAGYTPEDYYKVEAMNKEIYALLLSSSTIKVSKEEQLKLLDSVAKRLQAAKQEGSPIVENTLVKFLSYEIDRVGKIPFSSVYMNTTKKLTTETKANLKRAWEEMYYSANESTKKFAIDLARLAYITSGFKRGLTSFNDLIPHAVLEEFDILDVVSNIDLNKSDALSSGIDQIYKNNWRDTRFVKKVGKKSAVALALNSKDSTVENFVKSTGLPNFSRRELFLLPPSGIADYSNNDVLPKYLTRDTTTKKFDYQDLFEFAGIVKMPKGNTYIPYAMYKRTNKLGYAKKNKKIVEYDLNSNMDESILPENNVPEHTKRKLIGISHLMDTELGNTVQEINTKPDIVKSKESIISRANDVLEETIGLKPTASVYSQLGTKTQSENVVIDNVAGRKPAVGSDILTKDVKINIYAGANQNTELSNFAIRPFKTNVETPSGEKQYTFQSVEQGFHFYKAMTANNAQVAKKVLQTTNGGQLKRLTNRSNLKMTPEQVKEWDDTSKSIMLNLMYDSYAQNPDKAQLLLNTGESTITHTQDNTRWKTDFPEIVMIVRDMLKEEGFGKQSPKPIVAYRTQGNNFLKALQEDNAIGNPWSHLGGNQSNKLLNIKDIDALAEDILSNPDKYEITLEEIVEDINDEFAGKIASYKDGNIKFKRDKSKDINSTIVHEYIHHLIQKELTLEKRRYDSSLNKKGAKLFNKVAKIIADKYPNNKELFRVLDGITGQIEGVEGKVYGKDNFPLINIEELFTYGFSNREFIKFLKENNLFNELIDIVNTELYDKNQQGLYKTNTVKEAVEEFIAWMTGERHTDKLQDYRQAVIDKIPEMKGKEILYYKDIKEPSHATALDYLINKYDWNNQKSTQPTAPKVTLEDLENYAEQEGIKPEEVDPLMLANAKKCGII